jgi:G patch domain/KOW motif-containing protein
MSGEGNKLGFGFSKKKKSVVVGVNARGGDDDDGEDGAEPRREYLTGVSGFGLELKDKKSSAPKTIAVQDNTFEVGTGRRRKAPSFIPTEEEVVKDDERFETAERIGGKGETAQAGDVQYGLTKMGPKNGEAHPNDGAVRGAGAENSFIGKSLAEKELQAFKEDVEDLPEQSTLDDYDSMPIEDFGAAMLRGMGWEEGKPVGRNATGLVSAVEFVPRSGRLGLGATGAPPLRNDKKHIKPGESRQVPAEMVLAEGPEGKSRNVRSLDEKLVKKEAPGARKGKRMKVVEGRHRGLTGRVLRIVKEEGRSDRALLELTSSGENITVRCCELVDIDATSASGEKRDGGGSSAGEKRKREKREDPAWLQGNTRVRIVSKSFEGGRLYLKKCVVVDVLNPRECVVEIIDSGEVLTGVPQRVLETALPKRGGRVAVLVGPKAGQRGKLVDKNGEAASVQLSEDFTVHNFSLDHIAEYVGEEDD